MCGAHGKVNYDCTTRKGSGTMPKRKKHPKMPNGYGSVRYLGKGRALPYAVHPPCTDRNEDGSYIRTKPICYVPDWYTGFAVLTAYHAGKYSPGMELDLKYESEDIDAFCRKVLSHAVYQADFGVSLEKVYKSFTEWKFGENAPKTLSKQSQNAYQHGYSYLAPLKNRPINSITVDDVQQIINSCEKKQATKENIRLTVSQLWKYAISREYCDKDLSRYLVIPSGGEDEHGVPLTDDELKSIWKDKDNSIAQIVLILCYSGFRIGALKTLTVNTDEMYFQGGIKTASSKNRIVPIHSAIKQFVPYTLPGNYRLKTNEYLHQYNHTAHDCRHTFSMLCERYGVNDADRKRMMGHSFGADITNSIYGHRTLEDLRKEIEKIVTICV